MPYSLPFPNRLSNQLLATGSTVALLQYDEHMFDDIQLPNAISREGVVNCILEMHGHAALAHPDPFYMRRAIKAWSERRVPIWRKLVVTTEYEYNAIHNYDRNEKITETTRETRNTSQNAKQTTKTSQDTEREYSDETNQEERPDVQTENKVSAENTDEYQPESMNATTGSTQTSGDANGTETIGVTGNADISGTQTGTETVEHTFEHTNITQGNIGVTTTQQMIQAERDIVNYSVIEVIAQEYRDRFCLDIY